MITYICDGSSKKRNIGVGIVRRSGDSVKTYEYKGIAKDRWLNIHEQVAINQTLNIIERFNDRKVVIFNDDMGLVERIRQKRLLKYYENNILKKVERKLQQRIRLLTESGFILDFECSKDKIKTDDLILAHYLSRNYTRR